MLFELDFKKGQLQALREEVSERCAYTARSVSSVAAEVSNLPQTSKKSYDFLFFVNTNLVFMCDARQLMKMSWKKSCDPWPIANGRGKQKPTTLKKPYKTYQNPILFVGFVRIVKLCLYVFVKSRPSVHSKNSKFIENYHMCLKKPFFRRAKWNHYVFNDYT